MKPRAITLSKTFNDQLVQQIDFGEQRFGTRVAEDKKERVLATIENILADNPAINARTKRWVLWYIRLRRPLSLYSTTMMLTSYACILSSGQAPAWMISTRPQPSGERDRDCANTDSP